MKSCLLALRQTYLLTVSHFQNAKCFYLDVEDNSDIFDREVPDGVNCLTFGSFPVIGSPMVVAGGNCSITGFDLNAEERFWTVTGDNARALEFLDWDEDGEVELVAGSDDFSMRVFKSEEMIFDINEQSKIAFIKRVHKNIFGYALINGTYGVYYGKKRLWRQKAKDRITAMIGVDFDLDGQLELVTGFASGLVEARKHRTGDVIHKSTMSASVS
jgi:Bardet-Biedl syndrome 2 protein